MKRLESSTKKLVKTGYREKYDKFFKEWINDEVIKEDPEEELTLADSHSLPYRTILNETSSLTSIKIWPVFSASANFPNSPSLNDCLETGINFTKTISSILVSFRLNKIKVISGIRRVFLQISLHEKH